MELNDHEVVAYLAGPGNLRDGRLAFLSLSWRDEVMIVEMIFTPPWRAQHRVQLILFDVKEIKCLWTGYDEFYISLDPWIEAEPPIETDNEVFRAASVRLVTDGAWFGAES